MYSKSFICKALSAVSSIFLIVFSETMSQTSPTVLLSAKNTGGGLVEVEVTFSERVVGFDKNDFSVANGTIDKIENITPTENFLNVLSLSPGSSGFKLIDRTSDLLAVYSLGGKYATYFSSDINNGIAQGTSKSINCNSGILIRGSNLVCANSGDSKLRFYKTSDLSFVSELDLADFRPLALGSNNEIIGVANQTTVEYRNSSGELVTSFAAKFQEEFSQINYLSNDEEGNIYTLETQYVQGNGGSNLKHVVSYDNTGKETSSFRIDDDTQYVSRSKEGLFYGVTPTEIRVYDQEGNFIRGVTGQGIGDNVLNSRISNIEFDENDNLHFVNNTDVYSYGQSVNVYRITIDSETDGPVTLTVLKDAFQSYTGTNTDETSIIITADSTPPQGYSVGYSTIDLCQGDKLGVNLSGAELNSRFHYRLLNVLDTLADEQPVATNDLSFEIGDIPVGESTLKLWLTDTANNTGDTVFQVLKIAEPPLTPEICIVSVDDNSNKNQVSWEYDVSSVRSFGIYRETSTAGEYELLEVVENVNNYVDQSSNPSGQANRYRISALDTCGLESGFSETHKTMHLTISRGVGNIWNLNWDNYEGFDFSTYRIYRGISSSNIELLTEIASNLTSYSDLEAPETDLIYYFIEVVKQDPCNTVSNTRALNEITSRSNLATNAILSTEEDRTENYLIYPNPIGSSFTVESKNYTPTGYSIHDFSGKKMKQGFLKPITIIDMKKFKPGVYFIEVFDGNTIRKRLIKR